MFGLFDTRRKLVHGGIDRNRRHTELHGGGVGEVG
jgi:hypothetical protein